MILVSLQWCQAQEFRMLSEPVIKVSTKVSSKYSLDFGIENRNIILENHDVQYAVKHIQLTHFSYFKLENNKQLGFGAQYRFQQNFNASKENEFRLQQQFQFQNKLANHRFRTEQRIHNTYTNYRFRYQLKYSIPLDAASKSLDIATEALFQIGKIRDPQLEHRVTTSYNFPIHKTIEMQLGVQYRLSDYSNKLAHELFLLTTVSMSL